jgi:hypothetical protein
MTLISTYFPCDDQRHDNFCTILDSMLNSINSNTQIIIGGDINARIGICTCEEHINMCSAQMEFHEAMLAAKILSISLQLITYESRTPSLNTGRKITPRILASQQNSIQLEYQACMMSLSVHKHFTNEFMTVR